MTITLDSLDAKLDRVLDLLDSPRERMPNAPAYELPALDVADVVVDEQTVNRDGSIWFLDMGREGDVPTPKRLVYGYFSERKAPKTWALMREKFGATFDQWAEARDPWALYKGDPETFMTTGDPNWVTLMTHVLAIVGRRVQ